MVLQLERLAQVRRYYERNHLQRYRLAGRTAQGRDVQPEIFPRWQSALKCGLGEVKPRFHPFQSHRWVAFTCAPMADLVLASGDQPVVQTVTQQFSYTWKLWRPYIHYWLDVNNCSACICNCIQQVLYERCTSATIPILQVRKMKCKACKLLKHLLAGHSCSLWVVVSRGCYLISTSFSTDNYSIKGWPSTQSR